MIEFTESFIEFALATLVPIYAGMISVIILVNLTHIKTRYLSAFALGLLLWFLFDTMNDAVQLGVNEGYVFDFHQTLLVLLFVAGFLLLTLSRGTKIASYDKIENSALPALVALVVALGMGIHGFGEGLEFGALAAGTPTVSVLDAIGGVGGGISYFLHKLLESIIVVVVFVAASRTSISINKQVRQAAIIGLIFAIPSMIGEAVAYYIPMNATYFFAMGAGAAVSVALEVIRPIFGESGNEEVSFSQWLGISLSVLLGFFFLYGAALFHS